MNIEFSWTSPSLSVWFKHLINRNDQLTNWLKNGRPSKFQLSGFYNCRSFFNYIKQEALELKKQENGSDLHEWSLDKLKFVTSIISEKSEKELEEENKNLGIIIEDLS